MISTENTRLSEKLVTPNQELSIMRRVVCKTGQQVKKRISTQDTDIELPKDSAQP